MKFHKWVHNNICRKLGSGLIWIGSPYTNNKVSAYKCSLCGIEFWYGKIRGKQVSKVPKEFMELVQE